MSFKKYKLTREASHVKVLICNVSLHSAIAYSREVLKQVSFLNTRRHLHHIKFKMLVYSSKEKKYFTWLTYGAWNASPTGMFTEPVLSFFARSNHAWWRHNPSIPAILVAEQQQKDDTADAWSRHHSYFLKFFLLADFENVVHLRRSHRFWLERSSVSLGGTNEAQTAAFVFN